MPSLTIRYFASLREAIGKSAETLQTDAQTVAELRTELCARGAGYAQALAPERLVRAAVNQHMAEASASLQAATEVAFFPPVTGG